MCALPKALATVVGSPHDFSSATGPHFQTATLAPGGACSACHVPHSAVDNGLWVRSLSSYRTALDGPTSPRNGVTRPEPNFILPPALQCYDCHDFHGAGGLEGTSVPALTDFNSAYRPQNILFGYKVLSLGSMTEYNSGPQTGKSPESGYYETNPVGPGGSPNYGVNTTAPLANTGGHYFQQDPSTNSTFDNGDKLPCRDCHDPHAWSSTPYWGAFIRKNWPTNVIANRLGTTVQGSAGMANQSTPVGQRSNQASRNICIACHGISGPASLPPVNFSDIQSSSAPTQYRSVAIMGGNPPPGTIAEHASTSTVACVSCHDHNSIGASCSQCHGFPPSDTATPAYPDTASSRFVPNPNPGANDSHPRHYGAKAGQSANSFSQYSFKCDVCHYGSFGAGAATLNQHNNGRISVVIDGGWTKAPNGPLSAWDNTNYFNQQWFSYPSVLPPVANTGQLDNGSATNTGWGRTSPISGGNSCRNVYCHSAGRAVSSMALDCTVLFRPVQWNTGPQHCNDCHGYGTDNSAVKYANGAIDYGMPSYVSGAAGSTSANSHFAHVVTSKIECSVCHPDTVGGVGAARFILGTVPSHHVDNNVDVRFDGVNAQGTYNPAVGTKSCDVSCHGQGRPSAQQPQWGGGPLPFGCFSCHSGTEQIYKPQNDYAPYTKNPNPVDNTQYLSTGHGLPKASVYADNNAGAGFGNYSASPSNCYICHSQTAAHLTKSANDPFRLGATADGTLGGLGDWTGPWGNDNNIDTMCLGCHGDSTQRGTHTNQAAGAVNEQTHSKAITGGTKTWPVTPWKCVDCHDPHGDANWAMIRSGINAPNSSTDAAAGSDVKGRPQRIDANVHAVTFNSEAGRLAGSFAVPNPGPGNWGICNICHTQTSVYSQTIDNVGTHATRVGTCTTCHPHNAGFAPKACKGCHGPDGVATAQAAPDISRFWTSSGHGMTTPKTINVQCEACHDTGFVNPTDHKTDGSAGAGPPPANINSQFWPTKTETVNTTRNQNTVHLAAAYFPSGFPTVNPANKFNYALVFDKKCGTPATGCHPSQPHNQHPVIPASPKPDGSDNVLTFGQAGTVANPKLYYWYPAITDYPTQFYQSRSPWDINDITTNAVGTYPDNNVRYGLCVSCHDPHGTNAPINRPGATTNKMLRGDTLPPNMGLFCNTACHTTRTPP